MHSQPVAGVSRDCDDACFSMVLYALRDVQQLRLSEMHTNDANARLFCIVTYNRFSRRRAVVVLANNLVGACLACLERNLTYELAVVHAVQDLLLFISGHLTLDGGSSRSFTHILNIC